MNVPRKKDFSAFTADHPGTVLSLQTPVEICPAFDPNKTKEEDRPAYCKFDAIWDTGATNTVISRKVVDECGLKPVGMVRVRHVNGESNVESFLVNVGLPNHVAVFNVRAAVGDIGDADVLVGMDIIARGDFAITNVGGKTTFSFRIPSVKRIDYVADYRKTHKAPGRNDPCPCDSGKKYKKCCGSST